MDSGPLVTYSSSCQYGESFVARHGRDREGDAEMKFEEFQRMSYDDGLIWYHKGNCGEHACPTTQIGDSTVWECLVHGFISPHAVTRNKPKPTKEPANQERQP